MFKVLIVEDDPFIAMDLEAVLLASGFDVCGVASSQSEALEMGERARPPFAVVDVRLSPGDGRVVAREFSGKYGSAVLMATGESHDVEGLAASGALACIAKPYRSKDIPAALKILSDMKLGRPISRLPDQMFWLGPLPPKKVGGVGGGADDGGEPV